jgi:hypothetical protein
VIQPDCASQDRCAISQSDQGTAVDTSDRQRQQLSAPSGLSRQADSAGSVLVPHSVASALDGSSRAHGKQVLGHRRLKPSCRLLPREPVRRRVNRLGREPPGEEPVVLRTHLWLTKLGVGLRKVN